MMGFMKAVRGLEAGKKVLRRSWRGVGPFICLHLEGQEIWAQLAGSRFGEKHPWVPWSMALGDVLAMDWEVVG